MFRMEEEISLGDHTFWRSDLGPAIKITINGDDYPQMTMPPDIIKEYIDQVKNKIRGIGESGLEALADKAYQEVEKQQVPRFVRIFYLEYIKTAMACIITGEYKKHTAQETGSAYQFILYAYRNEREREEFKDNIEKAAYAVKSLDRDRFFADLKNYNIKKSAGKTVTTQIFKPKPNAIAALPDATSLYSKEDLKLEEPPEESTSKQKPVKAEPLELKAEAPKEEKPLLAILDELTAEKPQEPVKSEIPEEPAPEKPVYEGVKRRYDRRRSGRRSKDYEPEDKPKKRFSLIRSGNKARTILGITTGTVLYAYLTAATIHAFVPQYRRHLCSDRIGHAAAAVQKCSDEILYGMEFWRRIFSKISS